ncbi:MAG: hypothetical protein K2I99_02075, partial [Bacteroidaceae bacterium]|nr:hypothetical protein [Bacteroidaceae bacterium]
KAVWGTSVSRCPRLRLTDVPDSDFEVVFEGYLPKAMTLCRKELCRLVDRYAREVGKGRAE